jgi:hypothetical protein
MDATVIRNGYDSGGDFVQEVAIVRDGEDGAFKLQQRSL